VTDPDISDAIAAERHDLATMLADLPAEAWNALSLCAGWRVREVVAHMTMPFRYSTPKVILEVLKARGDFNRMADRCARQDAAELSAEELAATMRNNDPDRSVRTRPQHRLRTRRRPDGTPRGRVLSAVRAGH
jgi:uncharacterized protein (TIGR03083 family)